ncbi:DUF6130 family protein [Synechocystis sp. LKSZ1]|uniref:DUF6130 family protein n=1 Tax=Synechocystis sp. LKSZ1 TaxID=3144951 RepID=UPI00336C0B73
MNTACQSPPQASSPPALVPSGVPIVSGHLAEVAPPSAIQGLAPIFDQYQPQVKILHPTPDQVLTDTTVPVEIEVRDLPLFQDPALEVGPHLHVIVDNEPYRAVYNVDQPVLLKDLTPGTHTIRVFPVRPWHESFKNDGAFAQVTFHVLTKTDDNVPDPQQPLLTYSRPKGSYGAEPILLDFYLSQAPLSLASSDAENNSWRIRVTINGESFLLDRWQSPYLTGFTEGKNWIKLEFIDAQGNLVTNHFNSTVRVIDYQPQGQDTLSRLIRGELKPAELQAISQPQTLLSSPDKDSLSSPLTLQTPELDVQELPPDKPSVEAGSIVPDATPEVPSPSNLEPDPAVEKPTEDTAANSPDLDATVAPPQEKGESPGEFALPLEESVAVPDNEPDEGGADSVLSSTKLSGN